MAPYETTTFKSGKGVAMRLPEALGIAPGVRMTIEQSGNLLMVRPLKEAVKDPAEEKRKLAKLIEDLQAIGPPPGEIQERDPIEFPDRPGL